MRAYLDVILHQRGPEDIPASSTLLLLTLVADAAVNLLVTGLAGEAWSDGVVSYVVSVVMLLSVLWLLLSALGKGARWLQSVTAVLGADIIITAAQGVLYLLGGDMAATVEAGRMPLVLLPLFLLFAWSLAVLSFVVQRAANVSLLAGIGVAVAHFFLTGGLLSLLNV